MGAATMETGEFFEGEDDEVDAEEDERWPGRNPRARPRRNASRSRNRSHQPMDFDTGRYGDIQHFNGRLDEFWRGSCGDRCSVEIITRESVAVGYEG